MHPPAIPPLLWPGLATGSWTRNPTRSCTYLREHDDAACVLSPAGRLTTMALDPHFCCYESCGICEKQLVCARTVNRASAIAQLSAGGGEAPARETRRYKQQTARCVLGRNGVYRRVRKEGSLKTARSHDRDGLGRMSIHAIGASSSCMYFQGWVESGSSRRSRGDLTWLVAVTGSVWLPWGDKIRARGAAPPPTPLLL